MMLHNFIEKNMSQKLAFQNGIQQNQDKENRNLVDKTISLFFMSVYVWSNLYPMSIIDFTSTK